MITAALIIAIISIVLALWAIVLAGAVAARVARTERHARAAANRHRAPTHIFTSLEHDDEDER